MAHVERTRYRKINIDSTTLFVALLFLGFACFLLWRDSRKDKKEKETLLQDLEAKNSLYKKEAMIAAKEAVQKDIEKFQEETKERRQELSRLESKLSRKEELLDDREHKLSNNESELQKKLDEVLDKEDRLAELMQKQVEELERISGLSCDEAKNLLFEQLKADVASKLGNNYTPQSIPQPNITILPFSKCLTALFLI